MPFRHRLASVRFLRLWCGDMEFCLPVGDGGSSKVRIEAGDVIVMLAGVSNGMIGQSEDIHMCGGYPDGRDWDGPYLNFCRFDLLAPF